MIDYLTRAVLAVPASGSAIEIALALAVDSVSCGSSFVDTSVERRQPISPLRYEAQRRKLSVPVHVTLFVHPVPQPSEL
jgi:hypothetical protein